MSIGKADLSSKVRPRFILTAILLVGVLIHLIPFAIHHSHPLGYDTGFYRRYLINPSVSIPNPPVPGLDHTIILPRIFLDLARPLGLGVDLTLYGSYLFLISIGNLAFFLLVRRIANEKTALIATAILALSPVQYLAYWFMFYKNFFALILFFLSFYFIHKKSYWPALLFSIAIPFSHQGTTIIFLSVLGVKIIIDIFKKNFFVKEIFILFLTICAYLFLHPNVANKITFLPKGIFLTNTQFILLVVPLFVLALLNLRLLYNKTREHSVVAAFLIVFAAFPIFSLPYHERVLLFTDVILIIFASISIEGIWNQRRNFTSKSFLFSIKFPLSIILLISIFATTLFQIQRTSPLIEEGHIEALEGLSRQTEASSSVLTSPRLAPWVQGWSLGKIYAPGMLKDSHSLEVWKAYFSHPTPESDLLFLDTFPKPLYIFADEKDFDFFVPFLDCVDKKNPMVYLYTC